MIQRIIKTTFKLRRGHTEALREQNVLPSQGEPIFDIDLNKLKIGDGVKHYNELEYIGKSVITANSVEEFPVQGDSECLYIARDPESIYRFDAISKTYVPLYADALSNKVDKVEGKELSSNDFTDDYKSKLEGIQTGAEVNVQPDWAQNDETAKDYIKNKPTVDQTYSSTSENAQSGKAVAEAMNAIPQADWQQNDETANDYVKNRPGGYEALTEILPETTLNFTDSAILPLTDCPPIELDKEYTVTFDGTEYELVGQVGDSDYPYIGNGTYTNLSSTDTGEPFVVYTDISNNNTYIAVSYETLPCTYNIKIKTIAQIKIDEKYLNIKNTNIINGSKTGSLRTVGSTKEGSEYKIGDYSFAEGYNTTASGRSSHAEGNSTIASGYASHTEGRSTTASGRSSHAEGENTTASGDYSHAEGSNTTASGIRSHAEGESTKALGIRSHAEGSYTKASGSYSHAEGGSTVASSNYQHVQGKYNIEDSNNTYADIIGNGSSGSNRSNAATVDWNGNGWYAGTIKLGGTSQDDESAKEVATKDDIIQSESNKPGLKTSDGGEIFSTYEGENVNKALSTASSAFGQGTKAGGKGFKITAATKIDDNTGTYTLNSVTGLEVGMEYNVRLSTARHKCGKILSISGTTITVDGYPNITLSTEQDTAYNKNNYLTIVNKPDLGDIDVGFFTAAFGENCIAQDRSGFVAGRENTVLGQYGVALGRGNTVGYSGFVAGRENTVLGDMSIGLGQGNIAKGAGSIALGRLTDTGTHRYMYAMGYGCKILDTQQEGSVALGKFNKPLEDAIFTLGSGLSDEIRRNSFVIKKDGSAEITAQGKTDNSLVIKQYADTKVSKIDPKVDAVYTVYANGSQGYLQFSKNSAKPNTFPLRDAKGQVIVSDPEDDNAATTKKYVDDTIAAQVSSVYKAKGSLLDLSSLPTPDKAHEGFVYNIESEFTTTDLFVEGAGKTYPAGTNVVIVNTTGTTYKYDVLAGMVDLSNYATKKYVDTKVDDVQINGASIVENGVANIPWGDKTKPGLFQINASGVKGIIRATNSPSLEIDPSTQSDIDTRRFVKPIVPTNLDYAVKAAMCDGKGAEWSEIEQQAAMDRIGITDIIGDINTTLDSIIEMQNSLIGGN